MVAYANSKGLYLNEGKNQLVCLHSLASLWSVIEASKVIMRKKRSRLNAVLDIFTLILFFCLSIIAWGGGFYRNCLQFTHVQNHTSFHIYTHFAFRSSNPGTAARCALSPMRQPSKRPRIVITSPVASSLPMRVTSDRSAWSTRLAFCTAKYIKEPSISYSNGTFIEHTDYSTLQL